MSEAALGAEQYWDGLQTTLADGTVLVTDSGQPPFGEVLMTRDHLLFADEPGAQGGKNTGPAPTDLVLMALGSCTAITCRMYALRKGWTIDRIAVRLAYLSPDHMTIDRQIELAGPLDDEQRARIFAIAEKCPVHQMLTGTVTIQSALAPAT